MDQRVQRVIDLIREDLRREFEIGAMAQSVNLSPSRLRHLFKAATGVTPEQYLRSLRMQHAKVLLETTFLRVKEIRDRVGISDRSCFVRGFKRAYGVSPVEHRARLTQGPTTPTG